MSDMVRNRRTIAFTRLLVTAILLFTSASSATAQAVAKLGHPTVEERIAKLGVDPADGYRFVVFGDQRGLWKKDFPALLERVKRLADAADEPPLLFMVDTGDIVDHGLKPRQFEDLRRLLARLPDLPYLVAVGNHELKPKQSRSTGRENTAAFLAGTDPDFSPERMYYAKTIGPVRFLFLNSNDLPGAYDPQPGVSERNRAQMDWLEKQLQMDAPATIALMHHPFVQSAGKHRDQAKTIWNYEYVERNGRTLPEILLEGGVDLVVTGHVHSYEAFLLERDGGRLWFLNVSGKPAGLTAGSRTPSDWSGKEMTELAKHEFTTRLREWQITHKDYMHGDEKENQFAVITVDREGNFDIEVHFLKPSSHRHEMRIEAK